MAAERQHDDRDGDHESGEQDDPRPEVVRVSGEEQREQERGDEVAERRTREHELTELGSLSIGVLQRGQHEAQRRGGEDHSREQRAPHETSRVEQQTDSDREHE